jgi:hypothetical protein
MLSESTANCAPAQHVIGYTADMFRTIGHTFELMKTSWRVLQKDRELILFPIMSGIGLIVMLLLFLGIASGTGTLDRLDTASNTGGSEEIAPVDYAVTAAMYFSASFIVIFFNAALVAAALERLRGGDPNIKSGLKAAMSHLPAIIAWALISATIGLVLQILRDKLKGNFIGQIILSMVGGVWAYLTFFVIPVLVAEGIGPIGAIKRSSSLFRETWGRQFAASFGFSIVYFGAFLIAIVPAALLFFVTPIAGIAVGAITIPIAIGTVQAMEGIFKAALYEYALGESPLEFDRNTLSGAYRAL